jgi:hypothetical protein
MKKMKMTQESYEGEIGDVDNEGSSYENEDEDE